MKVTVISVVIGTLWTIAKRYPDYSIIKISQNTEKCSEDLRRPAVTQTPEKNHQLTLMWKTLKGVIISLILLIIIDKFIDICT